MKSTPAAARRPPKDKGWLVPPCPPLLLRASISPWGAASRFATRIGEGERGNTQWMEAVGRVVFPLSPVPSRPRPSQSIGDILSRP